MYWKSDDAKELTPKFDDPGVREEVLRVWKLIEARSPAKKAAEALAAKASKEDKPLKLSSAIARICTSSNRRSSVG